MNRFTSKNESPIHDSPPKRDFNPILDSMNRESWRPYRVSSVEKRVRNWEFEKGDSSSYPIQNLLTKDDVSDDTISGQRCHLVLGEAQPGAGQQLQVGVCLLTLSPACSLVLTLDLRSLVEEQRNCSILKLQSFQQCITVSTWGLGYSIIAKKLLFSCNLVFMAVIFYAVVAWENDTCLWPRLWPLQIFWISEPDTEPN